jgi:hypothetical protein
MPKGPQKFQISFGAQGLTRYGGILLFRQFCNKLSLRRFLQTHIKWPAYDHREYHPADIFLAHIIAIVAGIGRIENTQAFYHNGLIPQLLGFTQFPHRDTLRTFLRRFQASDLKKLQAAHDRLRQKLFDVLGLTYSATVDADTTVLMTYGQQEGVAIGYIPKMRHGKPSYAPILSSEGHSGISLGAELRPGNFRTAKNATAFLESILNKLPTTIASTRTRVRLDGAFYDKEIIQYLDQQRIGYVIVARMTAPLRRKIVCARYHEFAKGWEAAEVSYTPFHWNEEHRFIAVRRPISMEPESIQQRLFTFKRYTYHRVLVTNLPLTPQTIYRFYCDRANQELLLREFKYAYHLAQIPTRKFLANNVYMEMILWAYDLVLAFQKLCLPLEISQWNISTLRRELWWLPAEWVRTDNKNVLRLPARYPRQELFRKIQMAINHVQSIF